MVGEDRRDRVSKGSTIVHFLSSSIGLRGGAPLNQGFCPYEEVSDTAESIPYTKVGCHVLCFIKLIYKAKVTMPEKRDLVTQNKKSRF